MQEQTPHAETTFALDRVTFRVPGRTLLHPLSLTFPTGKVTGLIGLSGGERQRAWIAMLVAQDSRCLLLDEPTSALDIAHQVDVLALVHRLSQQRGLTVIAVLHDINMAARYCDYLVALRGGEMIAQGTPAELMRSDTLEQIYGIPMGILPHPAGAAPVSFVY